MLNGRLLKDAQAGRTHSQVPTGSRGLLALNQLHALTFRGPARQGLRFALNSDISISEPRGMSKDGSIRKAEERLLGVLWVSERTDIPLKRVCGAQARTDLKRAL